MKSRLNGSPHATALPSNRWSNVLDPVSELKRETAEEEEADEEEAEEEEDEDDEANY